MPGFEQFGAAERESIQEVLDTGVLMRYGFDGMRNDRWKAREMEQLLAARMQTSHAHLVSSGTAALSVAMASAGIGAGDEVILPTFTFVASFEAVLAVGAIPVLCDIDDTLTLDPLAVEQCIGPKTKAIMPVHMCGSMAELDPLLALAEKHQLILLEDACQAIGGTYNGKPLGSLGHIGCFSFDFVKTTTCGEGGGLITNSEAIYEKAQAFSDHGHDHIGSDRGAEQHPFLGFNYRISELHAAVGLAQLSRLDEFLAIQESHFKVLEAAIADIEGITLRKVPNSGVQNYSFLNFFLPDENRARKAQQALVAAGVDGVFYWYDNNWHYHRKWEHLKQGHSLHALPDSTVTALKELSTREFPASDHWMGRNLSVLIKLNWSEAALSERAASMRRVLLEITKT
ncbi:dTDP-4-amino-4,6-dideoxygalactose transaminase [Robiginitalea myxolifaciens]|uniref:dTDP-4-amino-4,6-dideoxygalactose transaminase n=1 Tax=Robiginitalea myxolifaciens TaxID=400055 RepID=A0A1I6H0V7_9FLAO|nr:DegT/DnrJ/EryC1/StrS family aminotransferase [Robiginitalea myxolifaciens]SFR47977.1 dTDP-4-amino-4,6-dideoxygalactose transaminase [Robiginitalea myxolifaciens]